MSPREHVERFVNQSKWGVFILAQLYVVIGLYYMYGAAAAGQVFHTVLGLLFVAGVLAVAMLLRYLLGLAVWWVSLWEQLSDLNARLRDLDRTVQELTTPALADPTLDIAALAAAGPQELVAATIEKDTFPRLVQQMDGGVPQEAHAAPVDPDGVHPALAQASEEVDVDAIMDDLPRDLAHRNLYRHWRIALRCGDVRQAEQILSVWRPVAAEDFVARRTAEFDAVVRQISRKLRDLFSHCVRRGEYVEALEVGERVLRELPSSRIAADFIAIKPHLERRAFAPPPAPRRPALAEG